MNTHKSFDYGDYYTCYSAWSIYKDNSAADSLEPWYLGADEDNIPKYDPDSEEFDVYENYAYYMMAKEAKENALLTYL